MKKTELIALTKELLNEKNLDNRKQDLLLLKKEYKRISNREEESFFDQQLNDEFVSLYQTLAEKEPSLVKSSQDERREIIELTKALSNRTDYQKASKDLNDYIEAFKKAGPSSKEVDDALWEEFKEAKNAFLDKRKAHYEELNQSYLDKKKQKEEIIAKAKSLLDIKNIKSANENMDLLFDQWKQVGFAGKEYDQTLWEEFSSVRKQFQIKKKEHHQELLKVFEERAAKKEKMIDDLKILIADAYFTDEEVKTVKKMKDDFSKIGFAGKDKDEELYQKFDAAFKKYFEEKKFYTV